MSPRPKEPFLIVGAGPTGLAAALLLAKHGIESRVVERRLEPSQHSKAFGVNARTLELLSGTEVTQHLLQRGRRMQALNLWRNYRPMIRLDLSKSEHRFPFLLIHSQGDSEALLADAFARLGGTVERGVELLSIKSTSASCICTLRHPNGREEQVVPPVTLGADGPKSRVREDLNITFDGSGYDNDWHLYDVEVETPLAADEAHAFILDDGALFMVRLKGDVWRVLGNVPNLLERLPPKSRSGSIIWESDFSIAHRIARTFQHDRAYLAGDAAHIHSGLGARGMNLGIEDAYVFAQLAAAGQLDRYHDLRHPTDLRVLRAVRRMTEVPRGKSTLSQVARRVAPFLAPLLFPLVAGQMRKWVLGLEHEVVTTHGA